MNKKACITHEVQAYIIVTNNNNNLSTLESWQVNRGKCWNVARFVQMWLAVPATSTPSKRVFSMCGLVETAKCLNLLGVSIKNLVFRYNNMDKFH